MLRTDGSSVMHLVFYATQWHLASSTVFPSPLIRTLNAVIFDMDGVLLDTEPLYTIAYNRVLAPYKATLDAQTKHEIMGRPPSISIPHVINKFSLDLTPAEFAALRKPIMDELLSDVPAMPGARELVTWLRARGTSIAVATSTFTDLFEQKTRTHRWFDSFDVIVKGDDPEIKEPKPAPDIFLLAARRLNVDIERCGIFEDSPAGLEAARKSGAQVFPVTERDAITRLLEREGIDV